MTGLVEKSLLLCKICNARRLHVQSNPQPDSLLSLVILRLPSGVLAHIFFLHNWRYCLPDQLYSIITWPGGYICQTVQWEGGGLKYSFCARHPIPCPLQLRWEWTSEVSWGILLWPSAMHSCPPAITVWNWSMMGLQISVLGSLRGSNSTISALEAIPSSCLLNSSQNLPHKILLKLYKNVRGFGIATTNGVRVFESQLHAVKGLWHPSYQCHWVYCFSEGYVFSQNASERH